MLPSGIRDCVVHCFSILKFFFGHLLSILRRFTVFDLALWCLQNFLIMWIGIDLRIQMTPYDLFGILKLFIDNILSIQLLIIQLSKNHYGWLIQLTF
jgi:hypothetical protein